MERFGADVQHIGGSTTPSMQDGLVRAFAERRFAVRTKVDGAGPEPVTGPPVITPQPLDGAAPTPGDAPTNPVPVDPSDPVVNSQAGEGHAELTGDAGEGNADPVAPAPEPEPAPEPTPSDPDDAPDEPIETAPEPVADAPGTDHDVDGEPAGEEPEPRPQDGAAVQQPAPLSPEQLRERFGTQDPRVLLIDMAQPSGVPQPGDSTARNVTDNLSTTMNFYQEVLGRSSFDGNGTPVMAHVNDPQIPGNARWFNGTNQMTVGVQAPDVNLTDKLDVSGHEFSHGVIASTSKLVYEGQSGALNESYSDVMGEAIQQWHDNRDTFASPEAALQHYWMVGDGASGDPQTGLRHMADPHDPASRTSYAPAGMGQFLETEFDRGGVHINSAIPNRAAYLTATQLGTETMARVWYEAFTSLPANADFATAARATIDTARARYGDAAAETVRRAWNDVDFHNPDASGADAPG